ncbi:uncharacterized protein B0I36DRAFT_347767 [Microdochium trichocladiopsis]|uniref:Uncharacterized protein n=1 Tax=Microdochium trichocladiopsis TaxID=1682393 RepID=A0A9P9BRC6_9PEZI|nr:uncharacterized protein B0I36DRAFT_347767 [Microdochium trichocladiopsis]KAH7032578.1 hypothetical protein B0I36DRAFT_347767 [Microdochium trichocladiopsis]
MQLDWINERLSASAGPATSSGIDWACCIPDPINENKADFGRKTVLWLCERFLVSFGEQVLFLQDEDIHTICSAFSNPDRPDHEVAKVLCIVKRLIKAIADGEEEEIMVANLEDLNSEEKEQFRLAIRRLIAVNVPFIGAVGLLGKDFVHTRNSRTIASGVLLFAAGASLLVAAPIAVVCGVLSAGFGTAAYTKHAAYKDVEQRSEEYKGYKRLMGTYFRVDIETSQPNHYLQQEAQAICAKIMDIRSVVQKHAKDWEIEFAE